MFKTVKLAAIVLTALTFAGGAALATTVPAGTLSIQPLFNPSVNVGGGTVTLGGPFAYFGGTQQFAPDSGYNGTTSSSSFYFDGTAGNIISYTGTGAGALAPITGLFGFSDGSGETYSFSLDTSIQTVTNTVNGAGQSIGLYLLGDLTGSGTNLFSSTPTAITLTLNQTGSSAWSFSATLANPPPGSGVPTPAPAPEPASMALLGTGLAALGFVRRRRNGKN